MIYKSLPSVERILREFSYDCETGVFTNARQKGSTSLKGKISGNVAGNGYRHVYIDKQIYSAHRLAWKVVYGIDPDHEIDHVDGNRDNNSVTNLRKAKRKDNVGNSALSRRNSSGFKGVHWSPKWKKWRAVFGCGASYKHLGAFSSPEAAHAAYFKAAKDFFGEYAYDGVSDRTKRSSIELGSAS